MEGEAWSDWTSLGAMAEGVNPAGGEVAAKDTGTAKAGAVVAVAAPSNAENVDSLVRSFILVCNF